MALAPLAPAEFAFNYMKCPSYIAHLAGEIIKIAKCVPVEIKSRKSEECYQELPATRGEQEMFMIPRNHILTRTGN